jgi:hypothetical protein
MKLGLFIGCSVFVLAAGCAAETNAPQNGAADGTEDPTAASEDALTGRDHFSPSVSSIDWNPGCGARLANGANCKMGFSLRYAPRYRDLSTTIRTNVDDTTHTITVRIDTWSLPRMHDPVQPRAETVDLDIRGYTMSTNYTVVAKDYAGKVLWTGHLRPLPAP